MGLQVRLRHALGERVLELPERAVDDPVIVGRAGDADVQVPSINVGQRHLVLFIHEGRWVAQNGPDSTGTTLGGAAMPAAHVLQEGDVLTLGGGADAPTVQVEAISSAARPTAQAAAYRSAVAPAPVPMPPAGGYAPPAYPAPTPAPVYSAPAYEPEPAGAPVATDDGTAWMTADAPTKRFYTPKRRKSSDAAIVIGVVATVAILAGAGVFVYLQKQKTPKVVTVVQTAPAPVVTTTKPPPRSMFTDKPAVTTKPTIKTPPPPPDVTDELRKPNVTIKRATTGGDESTTPEMPDSTLSENVKAPPPPVASNAMTPEAEKAFKRVESTYWETDPAKCLLAIDSFQAEFPGVEKKKLEQYREDMLDKAWWLRVDSLFDKQNDLKKGIKKTEQDIKDETEAAYKTTVLMPRLEDQKARLAKVTERLAKEMNYKETVAPPIGEEGKLQAFRAKRDKTIYDAWKARILKYVRDNHGTYPWANEK